MTTPSAIERRRAALPRLVLLGTLSAAFFSTTWLLNRIVSLALAALLAATVAYVWI